MTETEAVEGLTDDEQRLLDEIPDDGRARANGPIQRALGWIDAQYEEVKVSLLAKGLAERARGRGGALKRPIVVEAEPDGPLAVPEGWAEDEARLVARVPATGDAIGNTRLRTLLDWEEDRYWAARDALIERGEIGKGRGRGGSVYRLTGIEADEVVTDVGEAPQVDPVDEEVAETLAEADLYDPFKEYLRYRARDELGLGDQFFIQKTAFAGAKKTGGKWTRPDLVLANRPSFRHIPDRRLEVHTYEIKLPYDAIAGVYETVAHSRNVHQAYLAVCTADDAEWSDTANYSRVVGECERLGIGLIIFDDPHDVDSYEIVVDATRHAPDPSDLDGFIDTQISDANQFKLRGWYQ